MGIDLVSACVFCAAFMLGTDLSTPPGLTADMGLSYATLSRKYEYIPGHDETSDVTPKFVVIGIGNAIAPSGDLGAGTPASEWRLRFAVGPSHDEAARRPNVNYPDLVQVAAKGNGRYENFAALGRFRLGESDSVEAAVDRRSHKATDLVNIDLSDHSVSEERSLGAERLDGALGWRHRWNHFEAALAGRWARLTGFNATAGANMNNSGSIFGFDAEGRMHVQRWTAVLHFERLSGSAGLEEQYFPSFTQHNGSAPALLEAHLRPGIPRIQRFVDSVADRDVAANERLARAGPDHVAIVRINGERTDRGNILMIEDRLPVNAGVGALENPAGSGANVINVRIAGNAGGGDHAISHRPDVPPMKLAQQVGTNLRINKRRGRKQGNTSE